MNTEELLSEFYKLLDEMDMQMKAEDDDEFLAEIEDTLFYIEENSNDKSEVRQTLKELCDSFDDYALTKKELSLPFLRFRKRLEEVTA